MNRKAIVTVSAAVLAVAVASTCSRDDGPANGANGASGAAPASGAQNPAPAQEPIPEGAERVLLGVTGSMQGRLEPCGCAGGQSGGLARRMHWLQSRATPCDLLIESGGIAAGATELDLLKTEAALTVLFQMPGLTYDVLGVGPSDLELPYDRWSELIGGYLVPAVASDLESTLPGWPAKPFVEKDIRGRKARVGAFTLRLSDKTATETRAGLKLLEPAAGWARALDGAAPETLRILLVHGDADVVRKLVPTLQPAPDLVIGADPDLAESPTRPELVGPGHVPLVLPGIRGRHLLEVTVARLPAGPRAGVERIELRGSETKPDALQHKDVREILLRHRHQVKDEQVLAKMAETLPTPNGDTYVGSAACGKCHPKAYEIWKGTKHAHAWETLENAEKDPHRYGWPVTAYPDCVGCHVVGFRQKSGFRSFAETPDLAGVGCERCHGPGKAHADTNGKRAMGKVGGGLPSVVCTQCHDFEQSPNFLFGSMWPAIQHGPEPK